jgi:type III secretory pathway component EscT
MSSNETMEQHVNKLNTMAKELNAIGISVPSKIKMVFLMDLHDSYQFLVTSLQSYKFTKLNGK